MPDPLETELAAIVEQNQGLWAGPTSDLLTLLVNRNPDQDWVPDTSRLLGMWLSKNSKALHKLGIQIAKKPGHTTLFHMYNTAPPVRPGTRTPTTDKVQELLNDLDTQGLLDARRAALGQIALQAAQAVDEQPAAGALPRLLKELRETVETLTPPDTNGPELADLFADLDTDQLAP